MHRLRLYLSTLYVYICTPYEYIRVTRIRSGMSGEENTITSGTITFTQFG